VGYETFQTNLVIEENTKLEIRLQESPLVGDAVIVSAVRASQNTPTTYSLISREEMERKNMATDLPYMLGMEPSVVATSDAGTGIGYTSLRIRGSDMTRINVTINGIPLNDPESHAVYWVDIPDFTSSVNSVQLQRGVGSSTNGAGAFGASMNLETNSLKSEPYGNLSLAGGSFNTWKTTIRAGTGLIKDHWYMEGRGSAIGSDGYVDRAFSNLSSFFLQTGYSDEKTLVKAVAFGGSERTYQAWWGVDGATMQQNRTFNYAGAIYDDQWNVTDYYDNQTDNYRQNHYQLHLSRRLSASLNMNLSGHYTYGRGYYEEYRQDDALADYGLNDLYFGADSLWNGSAYEKFYHDTIRVTDLIRRRWLDNKYYGLTWSVHHQKEKTDLIIGGALNKYDQAKHFGRVIWAEFPGESRPDDNYYNNTSFKTDFNLFAKLAWSPVVSLTLYGDMQVRHITYEASGTESHLNEVSIDESYNFFNPKLGLTYTLKGNSLYASYSVAHREPIRDDFTDALPGEKPKPETLGDFELGIRRPAGNFAYTACFFLMRYTNQLVLTGAINDDGAYIRKNAGKSYRTGIELSGTVKINTKAEISGNITWNYSKTDFRQVNEQNQPVLYKNTDLAFSPRIIAGSQIRLLPVKNLEIDWWLKFVGRQYLDNTSDAGLMLKNYTVNDVRIAYMISGKNIPEIEINILLNNLFNKMYVSNGYVYDQTPYYYPQAGTNYLAGINIKF
jgi:iron complex outermembrane receptor protein